VKSGTEAECTIYTERRVVKISRPILSRLWTKVHSVVRDAVGGPYSFQALARLCISRRPLKFSLVQYIQFSHSVGFCCEVGGLGRDPRFVGERIPQISDMHFEIALTSEHVVDFG